MKIHSTVPAQHSLKRDKIFKDTLCSPMNKNTPDVFTLIHTLCYTHPTPLRSKLIKRIGQSLSAYKQPACSSIVFVLFFVAFTTYGKYGSHQKINLIQHEIRPKKIILIQYDFRPGLDRNMAAMHAGCSRPFNDNTI